MLAKYFFLVVTLILFCSSTFGQSTMYSQPPGQVVGASFVFQDEQETSLAEEFKKFNLRLTELENDVEEKLRSDEEKAASDDAEKMEERVAKLEESVEEQGEDLENLDGKTLPNLLYHSHKSPKMSFFGRIHMDYWAFPQAQASLFPIEGGNPQDRFNFRRLRIGIKGDLNDNVFYKYEGEFAGGVDPSYRDAYIGIKDLPRLKTMIFGNHKRPYGLDHLNSSRYNVFIERPFIVEAFNQDSRRLGISSNGVSDDESWNWRIGVWNERLTQIASGYIGDHYQLELAGRLAKTAWYDECSNGRGYAHFAMSGSIGYPDGLGGVRNTARYDTRPEARSTRRWLDTGRIEGADTNMLIGLESVVNIGAFQFTGEYLRTNVDRLDSFGPDLQFAGGYVQVAYFLTGEHIPWNRETGCLGRMKPFENFFMVRDCDSRTQRGLGAWQAAIRYSRGDLTDKDIIGGVGESITLGLNWHWNPYARMQMNWIVGDIERFPLGGGDYQIFGARMMVDF